MSPSEKIYPQFWPRLSVMDFLLFTESMQTGFSPDYPQPCLGASDLNFVINAPQGYCPQTTGALATLYFDNADCSRRLPDNGYQVTCLHPLDTHELMKWAEQGIGMIRDVLMHVGLVCIDLVNLTTFLESCSSKRLTLEIIPYEPGCEIPRERLRHLKSRNIFAALFAGADLSMQMYAELGRTLEELNPMLNNVLLTANCLGNSTPTLMFLSELEP